MLSPPNTGIAITLIANINTKTHTIIDWRPDIRMYKFVNHMPITLPKVAHAPSQKLYGRSSSPFNKYTKQDAILLKVTK